MRCVNLIISRPERHTHDDNVAEKSGIPETIDWALNLKRAVFGNPQCAAFSDQGYPTQHLNILQRIAGHDENIGLFSWLQTTALGEYVQYLGVGFSCL